MALKSIEQEWHGFAKMIFQDCSVSTTQVTEMKKAFFAGAWTIVTAMNEIGEPHVSEAEGVQYFEDRDKECREFKKRMMAEYSETN